LGLAAGRFPVKGKRRKGEEAVDIFFESDPFATTSEASVKSHSKGSLH
jgi:hypothetical protein